MVKGVILGLAPAATIVDLTHDISACDIASGAWVLSNAFSFFSDGTIHLAVVDPGVGSARHGIIVRSERHLFVGPDNGLLSLVLPRLSQFDCFLLNRPQYWRPDVSSTFHARDVFAPVVAHLLNGILPEELGEPLPAERLVRLPWPQITISNTGVKGQVVHIDHFGNLISNVPQSALGSASFCMIDQRRVPIRKTYSDAAPGQPACYGASHGYVEIGVFKGRADVALGATIGSSVQLPT